MGSVLMLLLAAAPDAALMEKLGARAQALDGFAQHSKVSIEISAEELDADGTVTAKKHTVMNQVRNGDDLERTLVKHEEDGVDLTEKKRAELEKKPKQGPIASPFLPTVQKKYRFELEGENRVAFVPVEKSEDTYVGVATIDPETGDITSMRMTLSKLPSMVDSLSMTAVMEAQTPVGRAMSSLKIDGKAGFLMFKKRFRVNTTMKGYSAAP